MDNHYLQALANALGITPEKTVNEEYIGGSGQPWSMKYKGVNVGDNTFRAGSYGPPNDPYYFANFFLNGNKDYIPDFDKMIHTPLGNVEFSKNTEEPNSAGVDFYPTDRTQGYIQALKNLLGR